jgi:cysteine dioxygenase
VDLSIKAANYFNSNQKFTISNIEDFLIGLNVTYQDVIQYLIEPDQFQYGRNTLYENEHVEVCVLNWVKDSKSHIHDHAESDCTMLVIQGELINEDYCINDNNAPVSVQSSICRMNDIKSVSKSDIHEIRQTGEIDSISLHVYYPPIKANKFFEGY